MAESETVTPRDVVQQWLESAMVEGGVDAYYSKREHARYSWHQRLELMAGGEVFYVQARDIGEAGLGLICRQEFSVGEMVQIRREANEPWVLARVVHATATVGAFRTGFELQFEC